MASAKGTINTAPTGTPSAVKATLSSAYVDLRDQGWAQQYLPELVEKEAEVFGNRTISGFLAQVGAEEAMAADQVLWSEQGRLHIQGTGAFTGAGSAAAGLITTVGATNVRVGDTIVLTGLTGGGAGVTTKCYVKTVASDNTTFNAVPYNAANLDVAYNDADTVTFFVYGSEYKKGKNGRLEGLEPSFVSLENKPVIIKDLYEVSGSDASAIGWIEVSGEDGQNGYLWYLKASGDTMSRFADYCEMTCIEGELAATSSGAETELGVGAGTEGLFAAITSRGNVMDGGFDFDDTASDSLGTFDLILKRFDSQGAIEENMMFLNRQVSLAIDDMLAAQNSYGTDGTSYGVFDNSADMALNLGFSGFRRGSYDFYKSDWKYLNDAATRGSISNDVDGVIVPAGVSSVYDQMLGKNMKRPFLHVRYRASQTESRKMKTWITGSVGAATSDLDAMEVNYLSERCLVTQGANNFFLLKGNELS
jgi:hypothetical protein